jgi:microcystin-dependent protein
MNKANYTEKNSFPLSTQGLDFIQRQILLAAEYAKAAGGNYILSGCEENGQTVTDGTLVINGEIIPFKGGTKQTTVRIVESGESVTAGSETYLNAYTKREIQFGSNVGGQHTFSWASIKAFPTNKYLAENLASKQELEELRHLVMPKGGIIMWSGEPHTVPSGFSLCDGQTVNGVQTPDLRGRFIVGYHSGKPNTPATNPGKQENYGKIGNTGGTGAVTLAMSEMPKHNHINQNSVGQGEWGLIRKTKVGESSTIANCRDAANAGSEPDLITSPSIIPYEGGADSHENRPPYYVLAFIIKTV